MYKVILKAEDGECVLSEHSTYEQADVAADKAEESYSDSGQDIVIREACTAWAWQ